MSSSRSSHRVARSLVVLAVGAVVCLAGCTKDAQGASWLGADPAAVAKAAGCAHGSDPTQAASAAAVQYRSIDCVVDGTAVQIQTYSKAADQAGAENEALPALGANLRTGTYYYASGDGWLAEDLTQYSQAAAKAMVDKLGGTVKSFRGTAG